MFEYAMVLVSTVIGLALALIHLMHGVARIVEQPGRVKIWWMHLVLVAHMLLTTIFWWWESGCGCSRPGMSRFTPSCSATPSSST